MEQYIVLGLNNINVQAGDSAVPEYFMIGEGFWNQKSEAIAAAEMYNKDHGLSEDLAAFVVQVVWPEVRG